MRSISDIPVMPSKDTELDGALVHGLAWTAGGKWATQVVAWASTLIVARLLSPDDYGLVGMATVYMGLANLITEFGVGTAVVTLRDLNENEIAQLNGLSVLLGVCGFVVSCIAAVPLGIFFRSPRLPWVVVAMSTTFVISSFQSVPTALLQRDMKFKLISLIDGVKAFLLAILVIVFAIAGFRYWTLVLGAILSALIGTGMVLSQRRHRISLPRPRTLHHVFRFSWHVLVSRISWYAYSNSDFVVSGRVLGQQALGSYTVAWNLANVPVEKIAGVLNGVTPALFSAVQKEKAALRRYFLTLTEGIALITLPLSIGLGLVAPEFVLVVLGTKWQPAIAPLRFLAFYVTVRSLMPLVAVLLNAIGESRFNMWSSVAMAIVLPCAFLFGSHWGNAGIAAAWMIGYPLVAMPLCVRAFRKIDLRWGELLRKLLPAFAGSLAMTLAVLVLRHAVPRYYSPAARLLLLVPAGAAAYALVTGSLSFHRRHIFLRGLQLLRRSSPNKAEL
jgi:O-antigen/teichoic acid export membrane protein